MIRRLLEHQIESKLFKGKAIVIYGARQVGKSSLLKHLFAHKEGVVWIDGDLAESQVLFDNLSVSNAKTLLGNAKILIVDEAQSISNIGLKLKVFTDHFKEIQVIATGSSSFDLANKVVEPLTGRIWEYMLYPLSFAEMAHQTSPLEEHHQLEKRLVWGYYPEVVCSEENALEILKLLTTSYLCTDILRLENLKKSDKIVNLLKALAFQMGSQVSYSELGQICGLDKKTVEKYVILLEQAFVIFRMPSLYRNMRKELKFSKKIYFFDNGLRNALISNLNPIGLRQDVGVLWENFLMSERLKRNHYALRYTQSYFWRTQQQKEIDLVEEVNGEFCAFEFKWNAKKAAKAPPEFVAAYPNAGFQCITPENYLEFLMS